MSRERNCFIFPSFLSSCDIFSEKSQHAARFVSCNTFEEGIALEKCC